MSTTGTEMKDLSEITEKTRELYNLSGLSVREISKRMDMPGMQSQVERIINTKREYNPTLRTLLRFAEACGYEMMISFRRKPCRNR